VLENFPDTPTEVQTLHDSEGDLEYVHYQGKIFHVDEIRGASDQYQKNVEEYLAREHGIDIAFDEITPQTIPWMSFDQDGIPTLFGDDRLREDLNLPENVRATRDTEGRVHTSWVPEAMGPVKAPPAETPPPR